MADAPRNSAAAPAVTGPFAMNSLLMLHRAIELWQAQGLQYVDLPWVVPKEFSDATRPAECRDLRTFHGSFVASGEQSFLQLWEAGQLAGARGYVGWTPCLRDDKLDATHQHGFMKAEWFVPVVAVNPRDAYGSLMQLVKIQVEVFRLVAKDCGEPMQGSIEVVEMGAEQLDIELNGIEIGSYGRREFRGRHYLYGTALALPRFTQAMGPGRRRSGP
jgi:hypothetical protein